MLSVGGEMVLTGCWNVGNKWKLLSKCAITKQTIDLEQGSRNVFIHQPIHIIFLSSTPGKFSKSVKTLFSFPLLCSNGLT